MVYAAVRIAAFSCQFQGVLAIDDEAALLGKNHVWHQKMTG